MHIYIVVSSVYIGYLIYKSCTSKPDFDEDDEELYYNFPIDHYISRVNLMSFFSEDENFEKLEKIYSNKIFDKMRSVIELNHDLKNEYDYMKATLGGNIFSYDKDKAIPYEIRDKTFFTTTANLNFIRWFILSDYFLYIEKVEN